MLTKPFHIGKVPPTGTTREVSVMLLDLTNSLKPDDAAYLHERATVVRRNGTLTNVLRNDSSE